MSGCGSSPGKNLQEIRKAKKEEIAKLLFLKEKRVITSSAMTQVYGRKKPYLIEKTRNSSRNTISFLRVFAGFCRAALKNPQGIRKAVFAVALLAIAPPPPSLATAADATHLVKQMARKHGVPQSFALRVARVESGVKCGRVGRAGERGPLQILPRSAAGLGYRNIRNAGCAAQTSAGMKHLAMCYRKARGNQFRAAACHNGGPGVLQWKRLPKSVQAYARKVAR